MPGMFAPRAAFPRLLAPPLPRASASADRHLCPGPMGERRGEQVGPREHRLALREMRDRPRPRPPRPANAARAPSATADRVRTPARDRCRAFLSVMAHPRQRLRRPVAAHRYRRASAPRLCRLVRPGCRFRRRGRRFPYRLAGFPGHPGSQRVGIESQDRRPGAARRPRSSPRSMSRFLAARLMSAARSARRGLSPRGCPCHAFGHRPPRSRRGGSRTPLLPSRDTPAISKLPVGVGLLDLVAQPGQRGRARARCGRCAPISIFDS